MGCRPLRHEWTLLCLFLCVNQTGTNSSLMSSGGPFSPSPLPPPWGPSEDSESPGRRPFPSSSVPLPSLFQALEHQPRYPPGGQFT
jgi:hypothetical protein